MTGIDRSGEDFRIELDCICVGAGLRARPYDASAHLGYNVAMHAHKLKVNVQPNHRISFELPSDFPEGEAEVIVLAAHTASKSRNAPVAAKATEEFSGWLGSLLGDLPAAPVLPSEVFERASIYNDQAKWPPRS